MNIDHAVIVVTGAGSGLGAETATHLASLGARVALLDLNQVQAESVAKSINGLAVKCDVTQEASVKKALDKVVEHFGQIHGCINCAGIAPASRVVGREGPHALDLFSSVIQVNLIGTFNVMRLCAHQMAQQGDLNDDGERGVIINTASVAAFEGQIGQAAYSASKGGVVSMTLPVARELAKFGIRVMTIAPGIIDTPMMAGMPDSVRERLANDVVFPKRLGCAKEYAALTASIFTNVYLNGSVIRLDGAIRMAEK